MIPTGTPASTNHPAAPSGELNSSGKPIVPNRLKKLPFMPGGLSVSVSVLDDDSKLGLAVDDTRTLALPPTNHHVEHVGHERRRDREEDPRVGDGPAGHLYLPVFRWPGFDFQ